MPNAINFALEKIRQQAKQADQSALEACKRSKYSIQDYWLCVEFKLQQLHDDIASSLGLKARCPVFPFRAKVNDFRRQFL